MRKILFGLAEKKLKHNWSWNTLSLSSIYPLKKEKFLDKNEFVKVKITITKLPQGKRREK